MFARAAIIGRVARERAEARRNILLTRQEIKKKTPVAPLRRRCFLPLMKGPCTIVACGLVLILCGAVMCNFAFHAESLSSIEITFYNTTTERVNTTQLQALKSLTYVGPAVMGMGVFIIIIACVVLLDKRDKILKDYINSMLEVQQEMSMELSYHAVVSAGSSPLRQMNGGKRRSSSTKSLMDKTLPTLVSEKNSAVQNNNNASSNSAAIADGNSQTEKSEETKPLTHDSAV